MSASPSNTLERSGSFNTRADEPGTPLHAYDAGLLLTACPAPDDLSRMTCPVR
ncbi:hypothetical protein OH768_25130 [Streptomyces sp. NBC_01622]|uniref:hypothetical protein n=1 Tax=Streptomyces sp. NBC_01622 TaxID=2975903 RepID=UPI003863148C|nr:hypothetical protein OH768_25130 [Streptomyces sp. NBC_01622]